MEKKIYWVGILSFLLSGGVAVAADKADSGAQSTSSAHEVSTDLPSAPRWKAGATSYYYSFQGTTAAHDNIYNFGHASLAMQLFQLSFDVAPGWTVMAMETYMDNYVETNMPLATGQVIQFKDRTLGWGDALIDAVHPLYMSSSFLLFGDMGVSVPTGSIVKKVGSNPKMNYAQNMQMGSGSYDLEAGTVGMYLNKYFQAGTHLSTFQRLGPHNSSGYKLGNLYKGEGWLDVPAAYGFTPRLTGYYKVKQAIHGVDPTRGRNIYTEYYFHDQQDWNVSAALKFEHALVGSAKVVAEAGKPLYQGMKNSDQVVVSTDYYGTVGVNGTF
jgi:hypothetical protein